MLIYRNLEVIAGLILLSISSAFALNINFNGTLVVVPPECTINGGTTADVQFGNVLESMIDNSSYKRLPIVYQLNCTKVYNNALQMTLKWNSLILNGQDVVNTFISNFGIGIYQDATPLTNGTTLDFVYGGTMPSLYAVPVKLEGTTLTDGGNFNATLTMIIDYR